ncbi:glutathione S-transferase family protein [Xanthobacteraceae bacterium Astr-EGSB]|uniref:glutathione S-transferase family protein n=1 Tax=Astrobacterium formosum TaxID=3069710 RepID=UPI0027B48A6C|nr:glutathione S-transferase family protein [Xanthobacteraceae bacterium Astr-EGSB]
MNDLVFYHAIPSRGGIVRWMLEEVGEPYETRLLDLRGGEGRRPDYLAINPQGKVPAIVHKGVATTEVAAICLYLADAFPRAGLAIPVGDPRRGPYLRWALFNASAIEPAMMDAKFPRREDPPPTAIGYRPLDALLDIVAQAVTPGPYLMGEQFTAADVVIGSALRFGMAFGMMPQRADLAGYVARLNAREAYRRAEEKDKAASGT